MTPRIRLINKFFPRLALLLIGIKLMIKPNSYLHEVGHPRSFIEMLPIDGAGNPLPWFNYAMIHFLEERLNKKMRVFEFGSGQSTGFYAKRTKEVVAVEHAEQWLAKARAQAPENVTIIHRAEDEDGDYCRSILDQEGLFNFISIDGMDRYNSAKQALEKLAPDGVILLDDTNQERYQPVFDHLKSAGMKHLTFIGIKPTFIFRCETTIFYRPENCFGI